jgi:hypothetical protein
MPYPPLPAVAMRVVHITCGAALLAVTAIAATASEAARYTDGHLHTVDFFQQGAPLATLISAMDAAGVGNAMVSGMPLMKKWHENEPKRPDTYAGDDAGVYWFSATDAYLAKALEALPPA